MFDTWLKTEQRPFAAAPHASHYFAAREIEAARDALQRGITRGLGPGLALGSAGVGKTMLGLILQQQFRPQAPVALLKGDDIKSRGELLQSILYEFGLPFRGASESELRLSFMDFLNSRSATPPSTLLIVDDADQLPTEVLLDLASLAGHARDGNWCLQLVLLGAPRLEEVLSIPAFASFNQRLVNRQRLQPWTYDDTVAFLRRQSSQIVLGSTPLTAFDEPVCRRVHELAGGVPRLINQLCEHVLLSIGVQGMSVPTPDDISAAWYELQQLPPPMLAGKDMQTGATNESESASFLEFGELHDEPASSSADSLYETSERLQDLETRLQHLSDEALDSYVPDSRSDAAAMTFENSGPRTVTLAENPFAETFSDEEIVWHDNYDLSIPFVQSQPRVTTPFGHQLVEIANRLSAADALPTECRMMPPSKEAEPIQLIPPPVRPEPIPTRRYQRLFTRLMRGA